MPSRISFLVLFLLAIAARAERPNILFIMADDHAAHALSCYGSKVNETPNLDRIAKEGTRFANAFVTNSICTPTRATLLTGKYSHLNGVPCFNRFDGSQPTVSKMLQASGYHTGMIGKWHLGSDPTGFDRWIVLPGQGIYFNPGFLVPGGRLTIEGYNSDVTGDLGIQFLETRPKDRPFFLMLHYKAPHRSWEPAPRHAAQWKDRVVPEPETLFDDYATRPAALPESQQTVANDLTRRDLKLVPPAYLKPGPERQKWLNTKPTEVEITTPSGEKKTLTGRDLVKWKYQRYMQDYLACVQGVDESVGKVLDYLDRSGLSKNTVVFYTADNGFYLGDLGLYDKRFMYEPGLHVPLIVRGPGIKTQVTDRFELDIDLPATFLDLAGEKPSSEIQGRSLLPILHGEPPADWRTAMYYRYYHDPGHHNTRAHYGIRTATHKLIYYWTKDAWEMFDLTADPHEQHNIANDPAQAAKFAELKAELLRLKAEARDTDQRANDQGTDGADGPFPDKKPLGKKTVAEAITLSAGQK